MNRRSFILASMAASPLGSLALASPDQKSRAWFELRFYHLRNDLERARLDAFLKQAYLSMSQRIGSGPLGFFDLSVGPEQPLLIVLTSYPSLAAMESALDKMGKDDSWNKALDEFDRGKGMSYVRIESRLLRAFASLPALEIPALEPARPSHVFELRIYESRNMRASETKIKMFDDDEVTIFRRCGLLPVFFGQTVIGPGMPSLTYMLAYESIEAREEAWRKFSSDPDWIKLRAKPELADREIVSNIHSYLLRPTNYSPIR
ncbi:MAG: NIPSNAP family containing protein [Acidobacteria bacterium]|nr:MAG: NIPSNAP family containing protein [Acidobacteriota bacterium]